MANRKFLFVNAQNEVEEEVLSVSSSAGAGDVGKLVTLDASGKLDASLIPPQETQVDWKDSCRVAVESNISLAAPGATLDGVTMAVNDRVLLAGQTTASQNGLYVWNGAAVAMTRTTDSDTDAEVTSQLRAAIEEGTRADQIAYLTTNDPIVVDTTSLSFAFSNPAALVGGDGIDISAGTVSVDLTADSGLEFSSNQLQIDFADTSVANDLDGTNGSLAIKAEDLSGNGANQGAKILGADPATIENSSATTIQGILEDLDNAIDNIDGVSYSAGTGGVTKGDLVYISAADTVLPLSSLGGTEYAIGIALNDAAVGVDVEVLSNDYLLTGAFSGTGVAGTKYYWDGSAITATAPSGSGSRVWFVGVAANANDLHLDVEYVKKNS